MELDSHARIRKALYRLVGTDEDDPALTAQDEAANEVADTFLTRGCRKAQRWMIKQGYDGWLKRSSALTWSGTDATDGGRYSALPSDFLRAFGNRRKSALTEADGDRWGTEIDPEQSTMQGNYYYVQGTRLWIARRASPPTTLYLWFHYMHPEWDNLADAAIDFPLEARALIPATAADLAKEENWLPGGQEMKQAIARALAAAQEEARDIARPTKSPRRFRKPIRLGTHW